MKRSNGFWVDSNNNKWNTDKYSKDEALQLSKSLINCSNCRDCYNCSICRDCRGCSYCHYCRDCRDCSDCLDCLDCSYCSNCSSCSFCLDFKNNPLRLYSKIIGSRESQTVIYCGDAGEQVVCGCWKSNLNDFEKRVNEIYPDGKFHDEYMEFIAIAKIYKDYYKKAGE